MAFLRKQIVLTDDIGHAQDEHLIAVKILISSASFRTNWMSICTLYICQWREWFELIYPQTRDILYKLSPFETVDALVQHNSLVAVCCLRITVVERCLLR